MLWRLVTAILYLWICSGAAASADPFKLLQKHAVFGRTIYREDWPALHELILAARVLPLGSNFEILALVQGHRVSPGMEESFRATGVGLLRITFESQYPDALYFPNSLLAEGRNALLAAAAYLEIRRGFRYTYYCLMDDEMMVGDWQKEWLRFTSFLKEWEPAIGLPLIRGFSHPSGMKGTDPFSVFNFDHVLEAVHAEASDKLLPYQTDLDGDCFLVSQWNFTLMAGALFRGHVLMTSSMQIFNEMHSDYRKNNCMPLMQLMSQRLRSAVPPKVESCFPDPIHEMLVVDGDHYLQGYLPWFERRALKDVPGLRYSNADLEDMESCDSAPAIAAMQQNTSYSWCRGCREDEALLVLQSMTSTLPGVARNWIEIGNLLALGAFELRSFKIAIGCVAIALRLLRCTGVSVKDVSWDHMGGILAAASRLNVEIPPNGQTSLWIEQSMLANVTHLYNVVRAALAPQTEEVPPLMPEERVAEFVDLVLHCAEPEHAHRFPATLW